MLLFMQMISWQAKCKANFLTTTLSKIKNAFSNIICFNKLKARLVNHDSVTISRDVQFDQLHEVGYFGGNSLDLVVAQAKFS